MRSIVRKVRSRFASLSPAELFRYGCSSVVILGVKFGVTALVSRVISPYWAYLAAQVATFCVSYAIHSTWSFRVRPSWPAFRRYAAVVLSLKGIDYLLFAVVFGLLGIDALAAVAVATAGIALLRFFLARSALLGKGAEAPAVESPAPPPTGENLTLPDGRTIRAFSFGDPEGRPLLYCHGWPGSGLQAALADDAARRFGFRVLSPDRPGIGGSDFVPGRRIADWPATAAAVTGAFGWERFHLLAVSGGGPYALATAAAFPERVRSVTICCGAARPDLILSTEYSYPVYRALRVLHEKAPFLLHGGLQLTRAYFRVVPMSWAFLPFFPFIPPTDRKAVRPRRHRILLARSVAAAFRQPPLGVLHDATRFIEDWGVDLGRIACPVVFHHGAEDRNIPLEAARQTAAEVPGAEFHEVPGHGHYSLPLLYLETIIGGIPRDGSSV